MCNEYIKYIYGPFTDVDLCRFLHLGAWSTNKATNVSVSFFVYVCARVCAHVKTFRWHGQLQICLQDAEGCPG